MHVRVLLSLKWFPLIVLSSAENCDRARTARVREGNLGQSPHFNWLGVLIVHLREWETGRTAMTGIVLIKVKYAIANADDVVRIPKRIFKKNTRAVFIPAQNTSWSVKPSSYITHPEYQLSAFNSIAIIKLNLDKVDEFPLIPICLPSAQTSHDSTNLYLTGIASDNRNLEKVIYKIQYMDRQSCEEYHRTRRAQLPSQELTSSAYLCGYAPNIATQCLWDNGMALVSNATGSFNLIGLAVQGPGCAAPARFMDLLPHLSWMHSVTRPDEGYDGDDYRRQQTPNEPIHALYTASKHEYEPYPFNVNSLKFYIVEPIENNDTILITRLVDKWERYGNACSIPTKLIYREYFELRALDALSGTMTYKLSLYDLQYEMCVCVRLSIKPTGESIAVLSFKEEIVNFKENTGLHEQSGETPEEIFRYYPRKQTIKDNGKLDEFFKPSFVTDDNLFYLEKIINCDLYIKFDFYERAFVEFELFADTDVLDKIPLWTPTTSTTTTTTTTTIKPVLRKGTPRPELVSLWGVENWEDYMVRDEEERLLVDVEEPREILETQSAARSVGTPGTVVLACWLISSWLRVVLFMH